MVNVVCALIIKDGKILVTQLGSDSGHPFKWEFPGGKINSGETPEEAIKREIREELGIEILIISELDSTDYDYGFKQIRLIPFICKTDCSPTLNVHHSSNWVTFDELYKIELVDADRLMIEVKENKIPLFENLRKNMDRCS